MCNISRQYPVGTMVYTIKYADTYYRLAQRYNTTTQAITAANPGIDPLYLRVGQQICIPSKTFPSCPEGNTYTIKPGDTFFKIAQYFNVSVDDLIEANPGTDRQKLLTGQVICIPLATPPVICSTSVFPYIVQNGDTFYSISIGFGISIQALQLANKGINPEALLIGQKICIPKTGHRFYSEPFNVNFLYPINWNKVTDYRYEGSDGFFQISAALSESIDAVCNNEAYHTLKPYGSQPTIASTSIQGEDACFIFPYSDQPTQMHGQSALIVRYPKPISLENQTYNFFILWADQNHIREIASTLTFLVA